MSGHEMQRQPRRVGREHRIIFSHLRVVRVRALLHGGVEQTEVVQTDSVGVIGKVGQRMAS